jgi:cytochrome c-type biogenesis protein CcmE
MVGIYLIISSFNSNIVFFFSPSEIKAKKIEASKVIRLGGLVQEKSVRKINGITTEFVLTDLKDSVIIHYNGTLPNLFREGQGMVARGKFDSKQVFIADELLAKHDENYMPKEVADALKRNGNWKPK